MNTIRTAVLGAGRLGGFHAQKLAGMDHVELVGVVDPDPVAANRVADACDIRPFKDPTSIADQIDAAIVAVPTTLHHALALPLLERGVHLMVEKPLAATADEAHEMVRAARQSGAVLQVGHVERFNPAFQAAAAQPGPPKFIEAVRAGPFSFRSTDIGVVLDLMIHDLELVLSLTDADARRVDALGLSVLGGHEDVANARIEFVDGCVAMLSASRVSRDPIRRMSLFGPRGHAAIDFASRTAVVTQPSQTLREGWFHLEALSPEELAHAREHLADEHLPCHQTQYEPVDALTLELEDFVSAIRHGHAPRVTGQHALRAVALAEQILDEIARHAWDSTSDAPVGPHALPRPNIIPAPYFQVPTTARPPRRAAG